MNSEKIALESYQNENNLLNRLLDYVLERGYLNSLSDRSFVDFAREAGELKGVRVSWLRVDRLPIHPSEMNEYDLLSRWQGVLSALHTWGHRLVFLLQRHHGETRLYLGTASLSSDAFAAEAIDQLKSAAASTMPGIALNAITDPVELSDFAGTLMGYHSAGAVTGIPSLRKDPVQGIMQTMNRLQTLDQLAFGIRDSRGKEADFALMVIADPFNDAKTTETIASFQRLGSEIHAEVRQSLSRGTSSGAATSGARGAATGENTSKSKPGWGSVVGGILGTVLGGPGIGTAIGAGFGSVLGGAPVTKGSNTGFNWSEAFQNSVSENQSTNIEHLNKFAEYAEHVTDAHAERLRKGRNLGFWNVGIYVLGKQHRDINTVMGMLRSVYSGDETYLEPIRVTQLADDSGALDIIRRADLIPLAAEDIEPEKALERWNPFGEAYQYLSTPMNTEELSLATSLPRRDVPGLRFVKSAVRFANNPAPTKADTIRIGKVIDAGVVQGTEYRIDPNALVRHAIVAGGTGSGKSTTTKALIRGVLAKGTPVLVIEPAKDEYVRWAIEYNNAIDAEAALSDEDKKKRKFTISLPGIDRFEGVEMERLKLNPFQPAAMKGVPVDLMTRVEQLTTILNASLPNSDVLPVIIDEALFTYIRDNAGSGFLDGDMAPLVDYPKLEGVIEVARRVLNGRGYEQKIVDNIGAAMETRFAYLVRGKRGAILNVHNSTPPEKLFNRNVIVNLSKIANPKDKALIMALLMLSLNEYRVSQYTYDVAYRVKAQANELTHLTVIEEAHNLLSKPSTDFGGSGNPQQAVADLFSNMLAEIRAYGEGLVIVDQIPTKLIPDVIKNTNYKIVHRLTSPDDSAVMAASLALREDQYSMIPALAVGDTIISGDLDDAAAWVRIDPVRKEPK